MTDNLTPWYPPHIKPVRVGVYETDSESEAYQHWNGEWWGYCAHNKELAFFVRDAKSSHRFPRWRGLKSPA